MTPAEQARPGTTPVITVADIAWVAAAVVFVLLRLGPIWQAPVGGAELDHLSGAWLASIGESDDRFVPTLFQAITALTFQFTTSEVPARILAFAATASIPAAIYLLRPQLGSAGALIALTLLAFDAPAIDFGTSASAAGFDLALTAWLAVALLRGGALPPWLLGLAAFAVAASGPIALPLVLAAAGLAFYRRAHLDAPAVVALAIGAVLAVALTTVQYGLGVDGIGIAPFVVFADSFERDWSGSTALTIVVLYSLPLVLAGAGAVVWHILRARAGTKPDGTTTLLLTWTGVSAGWLIAAAGAHSTIPVVALSMPLALLLGPALVRAIEAMMAADWRYARILLPIAGLAAAVATNICLEWADRATVGGDGEQTVVVLLYSVALIGLATVFIERRAIPTLVAAGLALAAVPLGAGAFGVALSAEEEPIPSPYSPAQARELRRIAFETLADRGGTLVIHPDLEEELTWPFRDSGDLLLSTTIADDATFVIWPSAEPPPEGFVPLEGAWALLESVEPPTGSALDLLRWYSDRNELAINPLRVAVYIEATE